MVGLGVLRFITSGSCSHRTAVLHLWMIMKLLNKSCDKLQTNDANNWCLNSSSLVFEGGKIENTQRLGEFLGKSNWVLGHFSPTGSTTTKIINRDLSIFRIKVVFFCGRFKQEDSVKKISTCTVHNFLWEKNTSENTCKIHHDDFCPSSKMPMKILNQLSRCKHLFLG